MDKLKILVVDDESRMRKLVRDFLEREGYAVLEAGDGMSIVNERGLLEISGVDEESDFLLFNLRNLTI